MGKISMTHHKLAEKKCLPCEGGMPPLPADKIQILLKNLCNWQVSEDAHHIPILTKKFSFKNYYHTMAFVNAIAYIAHQENHHPDLLIGYNYCTVQYSTHAINGLSENDFICAAKIDCLINT